MIPLDVSGNGSGQKKIRNSLPSHAYGSDWTKKHEYNFLINFSMLFKLVAVQI